MDADERRYGLGFQTGEVIGSAMEVLNELGHGLIEKPYENALVVEFRLRGVPYIQQRRYLQDQVFAQKIYCTIA